MRAHGLGDESGHIDDEDPASDWEEKLGGNGSVPPSNKRMYALRTNPSRLKSCRVCENCGKEFLSWKSFLEHGKCSSEDADSLISSPGSDGDDGRRGCGWSKRKRSLRGKVGNFNSNCPSSEEEDLANCLMMLSNATVDPAEADEDEDEDEEAAAEVEVEAEAEAEESCASASKEDQERRNPMNNFITPISCRGPVDDNNNNNNKNKGVAKGLFECKACKKVFNSHQALGGHRASHKKVKGCFAARLDHNDDILAADDDVITHDDFFPTKSNSTLQFDQGYPNPSSSAPMSKRKSKVHECSICHRIFSSGQALGGHKRCHWITSNAPDTSNIAKFHPFQDQATEQANNNPNLLNLKLDLNLPAPVDQDPGGARRDQISTEIYLQSWIGTTAKDHVDKKEDHNCRDIVRRKVDNKNNDNINNNENINNNDSNGSMQNLDDEADSSVKLAKLSELKDMNTSGGSSPWLQVGIGSTTDVAADP